MDTVNSRAEALQERMEITNKLAIIGENLESNLLGISSEEAERHAKSYLRELDEIAQRREAWRNGTRPYSVKEKQVADQSSYVFKNHARQWMEGAELLKRREYLNSILPSLK